MDEVTAKKVLAALPAYVETLQPERRHFFAQYKAADVGYRVVGTGSVGTRDYVVLMFGGAVQDPLFLQIKQELPSAYAPYLPKTGVPQHHGQRVVEGVRRMLVQSDIFLGWATIKNRPYLVRQLRDHKAASNAATSKARGWCSMPRCAANCWPKDTRAPAIRACCRDISARRTVSTRRMVTFAVDYADQATRDFEAWLKAIREGKVNVVKAAMAIAKKKAAKSK